MGTWPSGSLSFRSPTANLGVMTSGCFQEFSSSIAPGYGDAMPEQNTVPTRPSIAAGNGGVRQPSLPGCFWGWPIKRRHRHADDRRTRSEDTPHGLKPGRQKREAWPPGWPGQGRGELQTARCHGGFGPPHAEVSDGGPAQRLHRRTGAAGKPASCCQDRLADRGCDADWYREALEIKGIKPCIPSRKGRKVVIPHNETRQRHKIKK